MPYEDIEYKPGTDSPVVGILKGGGGAETKAPPLPLPTNQNHRPGDAVYADVEEMRRRKLTPGGSIAADPVEDDYDFVTTTATTTAAINGTPTREEERGGQEEEEQEEYSKHLRLKSVSERNGNALLQRRLQHAPSKVTINDALHSDDEGDCLKRLSVTHYYSVPITSNPLANHPTSIGLLGMCYHADVAMNHLIRSSAIKLGV